MAARFALLLLVAVCSAQTFHMPDHEFDETPLGKVIDKASMKVLKEAYDDASDKNVISSPLGVLILLSQYLTGTTAGGKLHSELISLIGTGDLTKSIEDYSSLSNRLTNMDSSYLSLRNKIYVADKYSLNDRFSQVSRNEFQSEVEKLNFGNPTAAAKVINDWAEKETRGNIKNAISPDALTPDVTVALFNVIFFKGHWSVPFNVSETKEQDFHLNKKTTVKKPAMHITRSLFYHEVPAIGAKMVELPYKERGFRMVIVLPDEIEGLPSVLEKVSQKGLLDEVFKLEPSGRDIDFRMPKFEVDSELDLKGILQKVGVPSLFSEQTPGIVKETPVVVSKAFQKAFVKVDELGSTAGAFTGLVAVTYSSSSVPPTPLSFHVDRPFLYLILFQDKILFTGTYTK